MKVALVTGAGSGLGAAVARRLVAEGGRVVLWDLNADTLKAAAAEVGAVATVALDVADDADDDPTEDLMTQRLNVHEKNAWMLRSLLQ